MTRLFRCDGCSEVLDPADTAYFGADHYVQIPVIPSGPDEPIVLESIRSIGEYEYHFCSAACLSGWAFGLSVEDGPSGQ